MNLNSIPSNTQVYQSLNSSTVSSTSNHGVGQYQAGQVLEGSITNLQNNQITVTLSDGTSIQGKLTSSHPHSIGEKVTMSVLESTSKTILLKFMDSGIQYNTQSTIDKALEAAGLTKNERNQSIVKALLSNHMSIDKDSIQSLLKHLSNYKDVNMNTFLIMMKRNIPITQDNISNYLKFINMEHNMFQNMDEFVDNSLLDLSTYIPMDNSSQDVIHSVLNKLIELSTPHDSINSMNKGSSPLSQSMSPSELTQISNLFSHKNISGDIMSILSDGSMTKDNFLQLIKEQVANLSKEELLLLINIKGVSSTLKDSIIERLLVTPGMIEQGGLLEGAKTDNTSSNLTNPPVEHTIINPTETSRIDSYTSLTSDSISSTSPSSTSIIHGELLSDYIVEKDNLIDNNLLIKVNEKEQEAPGKLFTIEKEINQLLEQTKEITHILKESGVTAMTQSPPSIQSSNSFMNHFQDLFQYIPLPLKLTNQNTSGELYVYRRKSSKSSDDESITVLLHLDMEHLGKTDIHISRKKNQLDNKFYFDKEDTKEFVSSYLHQLEEQLNKKGYQCKNEVILREENHTPIKKLMEEELELEPITRYNFDLRA